MIYRPKKYKEQLPSLSNKQKRQVPGTNFFYLSYLSTLARWYICVFTQSVPTFQLTAVPPIH